MAYGDTPEEQREQALREEEDQDEQEQDWRLRHGLGPHPVCIPPTTADWLERWQALRRRYAAGAIANRERLAAGLSCRHDDAFLDAAEREYGAAVDDEMGRQAAERRAEQ